MRRTILSQSVELVHGFLSGRKTCTDLLFTRYKARGEKFVASRLSAKVRRRIDPEDIYQSASLTLMQGLRDGRFRIDRSGDLWNLLRRAIGLRVSKKVEYHRAAKRDVRIDERLSETHDIAALFRDFIDVENKEEIDRFLSSVEDQRHKQVFEAILDGKSAVEAARVARCSAAWARQLVRDATTRLARCRKSGM